MKFPIGLFIALGKFGYNLYSYFNKGPKLTAALRFKFGGQTNLGASRLNPQDKTIHIAEAIFVFELKSHYDLVIKNTSPNSAYNIKLLNRKDIFTSSENLEKLASLEPNESLSISCIFRSTKELTGEQAQNHHRIPEEKKGKKLYIECENAAGTKFYTEYELNEESDPNSYSLKNPLLKK